MRPPIRLHLWGLVLILAACLTAAWQAQAVPRYAARYEQNCALCHVNPSGGGMRTSYASRELVPEEFAWTPEQPEWMENFDPQLGRNLSVGADFRQLYVGADEPAENRNFFQMQGDVYLAFQLDPRAALVVERGLSNTYEIYGVFHPRPWAYLKSGRFVPAYGWKFDDHTHAVRRDLGFEPPGHSDVGVEVGLLLPGFDAQIAVLNGNRGAPQDRDVTPAIAGTALARFHAGPLGLAAGASGYHEPGEAEDRTLAGAHGYATLGPFTWVGAGDLLRRRAAAGPTIDGLATSHEFSLLARRGLEVLATYDFFDPDVDQASGARSRYGAGLQWLPRPFLQLGALVRATQVDEGPAVATRDFSEVVLQLHILY